MTSTVDPLELKNELWPDVEFYSEQEDMIYSAFDNDETVVPASNKMGKDFTAAFIILAFFLTRHPCRIVTTSAKDDHLRVLWGEIRRFIDRCRYPLTVDRGGPLIVTHQDIRKVIYGRKCPISYVVGMVASQDKLAAMQGHHANPDTVEEANDGVPRTMFVSDESSSVPHDYYVMADTWARRKLLFGNTWPCSNFFHQAVKGKTGTSDRGGDIPRPRGSGYWRKVIKISADRSPNVRLALAEIAAGLPPSGRIILPGVKTYEEYEKDDATLDPMRKSVVLKAEFYEGEELFMFPKNWLERARQLARNMNGRQRKAKAIGIDPAEGGDKTAWVAVDELGVLELISKKTPDTAVITGETKAFMLKHGVPADRVVFDRGGGGKQAADRMRAEGYPVRTVAFGETLTLDPKRGIRLVEDRIDNKEERYAYKNRRAEMFGELREQLDPVNPGFAIPEKYAAFFEQMEKIPLGYDGEGRLVVPSKSRPPGQDQNEKKPTLIELIGHSPDELDALVLAVHGMLHKAPKNFAGAV